MEKDIGKEDFYKQLHWHNAFLHGHNCEHCGKVIRTPFCVCVSSKLTFYHFHIRCAKEVCKVIGVEFKLL